MRNEIKTSEDFFNIIKEMVGGNVSRIALCSVGEVVKLNETENRHQHHIVYKLHLYYGPFCVWKDRTKLSMKNPVYLDRRDVIKFVAKALSNKKSPYSFNIKTGKWIQEMMVM